MCRLTIATATVQLSLPDKAGFRLDARVRDGEIQSDFPELKVSNEDREARASGSVGNGLSHIVINNQHEGVEIRKASAVAMPAAAPVPPAPAKPGKHWRLQKGLRSLRITRAALQVGQPEQAVR